MWSHPRSAVEAAPDNRELSRKAERRDCCCLAPWQVGLAVLSRINDPQFLGSDLVLASAEGEQLVLQRGNRRTRVLDLTSSFGATSFGRRNRFVDDFIKRNYQGPVGLTFCSSFASELAEDLCRRAPYDNGRLSFHLGGSSAVSFALALCQRIRPGLAVSLLGSFHGTGCDTQQLTSTFRSQLLDAFQCDHFLRVAPSEEGLETLLDNSRSVSCLVIEPYPASSCYAVPDWSTLGPQVAELQARGVFIICDEIQSSYYRHGSFLAGDQLGITADVVVLSKSMTNGHYPLAAVVYPEELEKHPGVRQRGLPASFQNVDLGLIAASAVMELLDQPGFKSLVDGIAAVLAESLETFARKESVTATYHAGCALGIVLVPDADAVSVCRQALDHRLLVQPAAREVNGIRIAPSFQVEPNRLRRALQRLASEVLE